MARVTGDFSQQGKYSGSPVRIVLFKEKQLLFDSHSVEKTQAGDNENRSLYPYSKLTDEFCHLAEMIFGTTAMRYSGAYSKIHDVASCEKIVFTQVFSRPDRKSVNLKKSYESSLSYFGTGETPTNSESSLSIFRRDADSSSTMDSGFSEVSLTSSLNCSSTADNFSTSSCSSMDIHDSFNRIGPRNSHTKLGIAIILAVAKEKRKHSFYTNHITFVQSILHRLKQCIEYAILSPKYLLSRVLEISNDSTRRMLESYTENCRSVRKGYLGIIRDRLGWPRRSKGDEVFDRFCRVIQKIEVKEKNLLSSPVDSHTLKIWLERINDPRLSAMNPIHLRQQCKVCSSQFESDCFTGVAGCLRLSSVALPTKNLTGYTIRSLEDRFSKLTPPRRVASHSIIGNVDGTQQSSLSPGKLFVIPPNRVYGRKRLFSIEEDEHPGPSSRIQQPTSTFLSTLLTSILTHHPSWVSSHRSPAHFHCAAFNSVWSRMRSIFGLLGPSRKTSRTLIFHPHDEDLIRDLVGFVKYFLRYFSVERWEVERDESGEEEEQVVKEEEGARLGRTKTCPDLTQLGCIEECDEEPIAPDDPVVFILGEDEELVGLKRDRPEARVNVLTFPLPKMKVSNDFSEVPPLLLGSDLKNYTPDSPLQGTTLPKSVWTEKLHDELSSCNFYTGSDDVEEAVAIVGDTERWEVKLVSSSRRSVYRTSPGEVPDTSQLVADMLEATLEMWKAGIPKEFCITHIEQRLMEVCLKADALSYLLLTADFCTMADILTNLDCAVSDIPLLMSVVSTVYPEVNRKYGLSYQ